MKKPTSIGARVRWLLNSRGLRVNAAAGLKASGVPQRTLARIVADDSKQPRADAVQKLAAFFRVTPQWLLTGEGEMSAAMQSLSDERQAFRDRARREWHALVESLDLPGALEAAVFHLPEGSAAAVNLLAQDFTVSDTVRAVAAEHAYSETVPGWTMALQWLVRQSSPAVVRELLVRHEAQIRAGFAGLPPGMWMPPRPPSETPNDANRVVFPPEAVERDKKRRGSR